MGHHANSKIIINKTILEYTKLLKTIKKLLIKRKLNQFAFKNTEGLAGNSFFWKFVPFSYCPGKKRNLKISLCPFGTVNLKSWLRNHHQDIIVMNPLANRKRLAQYEQSIPAFTFNLSSKIIQYNYTTLIFAF